MLTALYSWITCVPLMAQWLAHSRVDHGNLLFGEAPSRKERVRKAEHAIYGRLSKGMVRFE